MNARKILEIKALSQTICNISKNDTTNHVLKVLYFVDEYQSVSPQILISKLGIVKSNLALLTKKMIADGLIYSQKSSSDRRAINYQIAPKGKQMLNDYIDNLNKILHEQSSELSGAIEVVLKYLNKKV